MVIIRPSMPMLGIGVEGWDNVKTMSWNYPVGSIAAMGNAYNNWHKSHQEKFQNSPNSPLPERHI